MDFTDTHTFQNLSAGNYSLCITGTDGSKEYKEVCFNIVVTEPEVLSASAVAKESVLSVSLNGGSLYNVELNGLVTQTEDSEIQLDLKDGVNTLKVFTNLPCQGTYEKAFFVSSEPILYRDPVYVNKKKVFLNGYVGEVNVHVFSTNGQLVLKTVESVNGNDLELDFSGFSIGIYYMSIRGLGINKDFKLIKE